METNNQSEMSFEQLVEMTNFSLDEENNEIDINAAFSQEDQNKDNIENKQEDNLDNKDNTETIKVDENIQTNQSVYSELVKKNLESGEWEDVLIDIGDEGEKKLSELVNLDEETYNEIKKTIDNEKQEIFDKKYVDVEGLDETQVKLINIIKNGDLDKARELFEKPEQLLEPFQGYDPDNDEHNEQVLSWFHTSRGHTPEEVKLLVEASKKDLSIDKKAQQIVDFQKNAFKENLEKKNTELLEQRQKEESEIKEYRKNLTTTFKEGGLSDTAIRKFVDSASRKDKDGNFDVDNAYEALMKDPQKAADLIYFILDKENYLKKVTAETKKNVHLGELKKIKIINENTGTRAKKEEERIPSNKSSFEEVLSNMTFN